MRDRLEELQQKAQECWEPVVKVDMTQLFSGEGDPNEPVGVVDILQQAVVFEEEPVIQNFLAETKNIHHGITEMETKVIKFSQQQKTLVAAMRRFSVMKKESSIARDIKIEAESLHMRLDALSKQAQRTEDQRGPTAVTTRIQRSQLAALHGHFRQVMRQYNEALLTKQERCQNFIIRQLEVSGREVTEEEVNEMVATGKWEVFNENLLNDSRITRSQLSEIELRHKELLDLESNMKELRDLFLDIFMEVEEQGACVDHIGTHVERTQDYVAATSEKLKMAARYKKRNPLRELCCCCCPPWRCCW